MKCPIHPKYKAVQAPRIDCTSCWNLFKGKHGNTVAIEKYLRFHRSNALRLDKTKKNGKIVVVKKSN